jgi:hypothetical protein
MVLATLVPNAGVAGAQARPASSTSAQVTADPPLPPDVAGQQPKRKAPGEAPPDLTLPVLPADATGGNNAAAPRLEDLGKAPADDRARVAPTVTDEVPERRTANSKTFATDRAGVFVTETANEPVHFQDAKGRWQDIDTDLVAGSNGRTRNKANAFSVSLAADSTDGAVASLELDASHSVAFGIQDAAKVKAEKSAKDAKTVTYPQVAKGVDVRFTSTATGLKEEIVLASAAAPDRYLFPLKLKGLTASIDEKGDVVYRDSTGRERARTPHGFMTDAAVDPRSGEAPMSFGVTYALVPQGHGVALEVRLDRAWLSDPARVWPVTVDPTLTPSYTGPDDTYVQSSFNANNSGDTQLKVGTYNGGGDKARSFLHFDTSAVNGKVINSARLKMFEYHSFSCEPRPISVHRMTQGWNGTTMTGFPGAAYDGNPLDTLNVAKGYTSACPGGWLDFNVTSAVALWAAGGANLGLALKASESDSYAWKKLYSYEAGASSRPVVQITWSEPATVPSAPQAVAASPRNAGAVVTWAPPASNGGAAVSYYILGAYVLSGSNWVPVSTTYPCGTCTSATLGGLGNGATYVFAVWAVNAAGQGAGAVTNTIIAGTPTAPQSVAAYPGNRGALVTWTPPASVGASAVDLYGVWTYKWPSLEVVSLATACGTCTSVVVPDLTNGQAYVMGVYAHNSVNWGLGMGTNVVTPNPTVPDAPASVFAGPAAGGTVNVAWSPPANDGGATIDHYWVGAYKTTPSLTYVSSVAVCPTCSPANMGGLTAGQPYQFYVVAHNGHGYGAGAWSNVVTAGGSPDLLRPTSVAVTRGDGSVAVTWTPPVLRLGALTSYVVKAFLETNPAQPVATKIVTDPATGATVTGLPNGQRHFVTVTASTLIVINAESDRSAVFVPAGPPFAPTSVTAEPSDRGAKVTWPTPNNNGEPITGYEVAIVDPVTGAQMGSQPAAGSPAQVTGLTNGTRYAFQVRATNIVGTGPWSGLSGTVIPAGAPFPAENLVVDPGDGFANLSWSHPSTQPDGTPGDNGSPLTTYLVEVYPGSQSFTLDAAITGTIVTGLNNGTMYRFSVTANNAIGAAEPVGVVGIPAAMPTTPTGVSGTPGDGYVLVKWSPSSPTGVPVTYTVVASPGGQSVSTLATSALVSGLTNGQPYTFTVQATNSEGTSAVSSPSIPVTPVHVDPPPPGPQCQSSPLPEPPGEVLNEDGAVLRRIDVPCMNETHGKVRMGFFIADEEVRIWPRFGRVVGDGDGRDFDPHMDPEDNRIYIEIDFSTGTGYVQSNKSCSDKSADSHCRDAKSLVGAFDSSTQSSGIVSFDFVIGNSLAQDFPILNRFKISADLDVLPMSDGGICLVGQKSWFPAFEAYYDHGGQTHVLVQKEQVDGGVLGLALPDHGVGACY